MVYICYSKLLIRTKKKTNEEKSQRKRQTSKRKGKNGEKVEEIAYKKLQKSLEAKQLALKFDTFGWMHFNGFILPWNLYTRRKWHTEHFSLAILYKQKK